MRLSKFIPDHNKLVSTGTVAIWLKDEKGETPLELPITSEGVLELRDELLHHKPIAPKKALVIKADSDVGRELGLTEDTVKLVQDETDEWYINALNEFHTEFVWHIVLQGLAMEFTDTKGKPITDFEGKKAVLLLNGLTIAHLETIFAAILKLGEAHAIDLEEYIQRTTGLTKSIQKKIIRRSKKDKTNKAMPLFNETAVMKEYGIDPAAWEKLGSIDRRVLNYSLLLKYHQEAEVVEQRQREQQLEQNKQRVMNSMPTFSGKGGR
jgi:hypothetical protein